MIKLLIVLVILLGIIAISQLMRVYELSSELRNKREEDITLSDNKLNANMMIVFMLAFYGFFIWLLCKYGDGGLGVPASLHGQVTDWLMDLNFVIIIAVFFITNTLLFVFAFKYYYRKDRKALFYSHNNKLELLWTSVPAVVLAVIIILGLRTWNKIQAPASPEAIVVEVYAKQFDWTARYSGENNELGHSDFRLVNTVNPLGVLTHESIALRVQEIQEEIDGIQQKLDTEVMPDFRRSMLEEDKERLTRHLKKVKQLESLQSDELDKKANDDKITRELHLIVGKEYELVFRSQDVIHSAFFPHHRAQMNTVPGMSTRLKMVPTITTDSMRTLKGDPTFEYVLLCNKVCGAAHYNMQMKVVVETEEEFNAWYRKEDHKTIKQAFAAPSEGEAEASSETVAVEEPQTPVIQD